MPRRRLRGNKQQPSGDRNATRFRAPSSSSSDSSSGNEETETERRPPPLERRLMQRPYTSRLFLPDSISDEDDGPPPLAIRARRDRVPAMERSSEEEEEDCDESSSDIDSPIRAVTLPNRGTSNNENDRRQQQPLANRDGDNDSSNDDDDDDDSDPSSSSLDGELPALIPRPAMYSTSESGGSEDEEDEDSEADSDDYDDDDDDDDDVLSLGNSCGSDLSPPPLLDPQMSTDFSTEGSDSDRDGSGRWQIFDGRRLEKGDFCLYKLANDKVWTQGVVTKVEVKERVPTPIRIHRPARKFCRRIDYHIHPLDSEEGGTPLLPPFIAKDPNNGRVLKYKEGDSVLVNVAFEALPPLEARAKGMEENKTYWEEAVIEKVWPSEQYPPVAYRIKLSQFPLANAIFKKEEDLRSIRPYDQTLRFDRTTRVQVRTKTGEWKVGTIIGRHYTPEGVTEPYAPYRVMLDGNEAEPSGCVPVFHDTVSHIRCIGEEEPSPRALLEEGLQQNAQLIFYRELLETQSPRCNIEQLVRDYCPEFWIAKAIEYGNYVALWWMEQDLKIDLNRYLDIDPQQPKNKEHYFFRGRGLLHCLVDSPNSRKFFDTWAAISREFHGGILEDSGTPGVLACLTGKNDEKVYATATTMPPRNALTRKDKDGRTFMHCLALRGDIRALSIIADVDECDNLQQHLWELVSIVNEKLEPLVAWPDDNGKTAADLARSSGRHHIAAILDRFAAFCCVHALSKTLQSVYPSKKKIKNIVSLYSKAKDRAILSRRDLQEVAILQDLKKYSKKYPEKYFCSIEKVCLLLAQTGNLPVLKWLYVNAGASLAVSPSEFFGSSTLPVETTADAGEFSSKQTDKTVEPLDIVACAVHGCSTEWKHKPLLGEEDNELLGSVMDRDYWGFIMGQDSYKGFTSKEKWSGDPRKSVSGASSKLVKFLKDKKSSTYVGGIMKEFKLSLIQDDKDLPRRLEVLQWLVSKLGLKPPNVNDVLRWRQNGVLKWMVRGKYIDLSKLSGSIAEIVHFVNSSREQRLWLRVPESTKLALAKLSVGEMLCFLAVEFDDLQSLDYLIKVQGIAASVWFQGWNLLQVSAHYGRREIATWLVRNNYVDIGAKMAETRFDDGPSSCHIAISAGDVLLAKFLQSEGYPDEDSSGRSMLFYGENSKDEVVQEWYNDEKRREMFRSNVATLCSMVFEEQPSWEAIKSHVSETNCMTDKLWLENGYDDPEKSVGQTGRSFWAIVDRVAEIADSDFLFWFYEQCMPDGYMDPSNHRQGASDMRAFWKRTKSGANDLDALRMTNGESDLRRLLEKTKKKVTSEEFFALKKVCSEVLFSRSGYNDQLVRNLAAPIDPLLKRIDSKIRLRRSTILMNAISDEKEKLRKSQFLNDLLVSASVLLEKYLREDSTVCSLETALLGLGAASKLLKKEHPSHPAFLTNSTDFGDSCPFRADNSINPNYKPKAPQELLSFASRNGFGWTIFGLVTSKDHIETLKWLVKKCPDQWEEKCILQMIRLAECCGAEKIIHWLLEEECADNKNERLGFRYLSALLGAAEAGHLAHVKKYFPYAKQFLSNAVSSPKAASPLSAAVMGLYSHADSNGEAKNKVVSRYIESIAWLGSHNEVQRFDAIRTAARCLESSGMRLKLFFAIFKTLTSDDIWSNRDKLGLICRNFLARRIQSKDKQDLISWVRILVKENVDIQMVLDSHVGHGEDGIDLSVVVEVVNLQRKQLLGWSPFWKLYNDVDASEMPWVSTYNSKGLKMIHCASVCNRVDVLQWHILEGMAQFEESDKFNRTAFRLAVATDAASVRDLARWHSQGAKIGTFLSSCYRRKLACLEAQKRMKALNIIQALWMRGLARVKFAAIIETRIYQRKLFDKFWGDLVSEAPTLVHIEPNSWEAIKHFKEEFDLARTPEELAEYGETFEQLDAAGRAALTEDDSDDEGHADNVEKVEGLEEEKKEPDDSDDGEPEEQPGELCKQFLRPIPEMDNIKLTKSVLAWLRKTEQKYVDLFLRRIEQLARGERSRILQKNLTGSKTTIYETYLEQKSAQRIMWTPVVEAGKHSILIWYVARHKEVSRLMALIDHAEQRQAKVFVSAAESLYENDQEANDIMVIDPEDILLDPNGDTPLKLHQVSADNIKKLANPYWEPPLRLTPQERFCVEKKGTVLVLGRSGTGKTLCISNRIDREGSMHNDDPSFKQLFVARSNRICRRVRRLVDKEKGRKCKYYTFQKLLNQCSEMVKESDGLFDNRAYVDFARYKREFYRENKDGLLDPLVIWSQFRTFIKGSILAVQKDRPLEEKEYVEDLGCNACKLNEQQRQCAYSAFLFYKEQLESCNLWDDCDRVHYLLQQIKQVDRNCLDENHYSRIYVDEIQDFTQAELALFYTLCRDHCLFLAGDNAQSVVQGVDFRFEDLRMVAYSLYGANNRYIPEKPLTVSKNFRSHAGVLNVAGGVLERMYAAFPASFKKLPPEKGIFHGPRPGVFRDVDSEGLKSLLERNPGLHVLCHDQTVDSMKDILHCCENNIVMGIRDSKGLEFRDIVIVDFFSNLAEDLQKPFRELLRDREISDIKPGYPQLETQLKLLYTGITRCSRRLFFLETKKSIAGQAFFKWLTRDRFEKDPVGGPGNEFKKLPPLAVNQDASKTENLMTPDEFRSSGVDAAINAESMEDSCSKALFWIERAVRNFERVGDENLLRKALAHKASLEIRVQLEEDPDGYELTEENEEEISKVAHACAKEGLLPELYNLVSVVMPKLSELAQNELKKHLMTNLDEFAA